MTFPESPSSEEEKNLSLEALPLMDRHKLQLGRRLGHLATGSLMGLTYLMVLNHQQVIYLLGAISCIVYLLEQIRINYPELQDFFAPITRLFFRAEEQLKESAAIPYVMGVLLCIITFPKESAIIGILTLAICDPLSAIVGISFGRKKIMGHKTWEGSLAFFTFSALISYFILSTQLHLSMGQNILISILTALCSSFMEILPIRIDDNLTIPLFTSLFSLIFLTLFR